MMADDVRVGPEAALGRKEEIIAAAIRVIARKGVPGASMRAIAREMGLTTGVITHYFSDKNELLREALQSFFDPWLKTIDSGKSLGNPWEKLQNIFLPGITELLLDRGRKQVWLGMLLQMEHQPQLAQAYREKYGRIRDIAFALIRQCQNEGFIRPELDPVVEGNRLFAVIDGLLVAVLGEPERFNENLLWRIMNSQVEALRAPGAR
jgi:AcrR family transcriptional regulator